MKEKILIQLNAIHVRLHVLYEMVIELDNHVNQCKCDDRRMFDFGEIVEEGAVRDICISCGGYVEYQNDVYEI